MNSGALAGQPVSFHQPPFSDLPVVSGGQAAGLWLFDLELPSALFHSCCTDKELKEKKESPAKQWPPFIITILIMEISG